MEEVSERDRIIIIGNFEKGGLVSSPEMVGVKCSHILQNEQLVTGPKEDSVCLRSAGNPGYLDINA